jgi:hypothetical protein
MHWTHEREIWHWNCCTCTSGFCTGCRSKGVFGEGTGFCWSLAGLTQRWRPSRLDESPWRMPSSEMWRPVAFVRTEVSEELIASNIKMERISELGTTLAVTSSRSTLRITWFFAVWYKASHPRRRHSSYSPARKPQDSYLWSLLPLWLMLYSNLNMSN